MLKHLAILVMAFAVPLAGCVSDSPVPGNAVEPTPVDDTPEPVPYDVPSSSVSASPIAPTTKQPDPDGIVRYTLETTEVIAQLADGKAYEFWTFGGTVPGPMLRVREGDTVELTLKNHEDSKNAHSIDLHAVTGPGGGAKVTQTSPGDETSFRFKAIHPGVYVYHCATPHVPTHIANGMYGLIVVEPEGGLAPVDREFYVVQGEFYTTPASGLIGLLQYDISSLFNEEPQYVLFNGHTGALTGENAMQANVGETIRIFFGVGGGLTSSFHVIGEIFDRVYPDGNTPVGEHRQTVMVPAAGAYIVEFEVEYPGTYILVDHTLTRTFDKGAIGMIEVNGPADASVFEAKP